MIGCAGPEHGAMIRVNPDLPGATRTQKFTVAYAAPQPNGQWDVVLLDENQEKGTKDVIYMRVIWWAKGNEKKQPPVTTNASFDWYLAAPGPTGANDLLRYSGQGTVRLIEDRRSLWVSVDRADMNSTGARGSTKDTMGPASLNGSFYAYIDEEKVREHLFALMRQTADMRREDAEVDEARKAAAERAKREKLGLAPDPADQVETPNARPAR